MSQTEWLPIETAPDETPIWLYSKGDGMWIGERHYDSDGWLWGNCYMSIYIRTDGTWASNDCQIDDDYQPTHWMPLPAPPSFLLLDREEAGGEIAEPHSGNVGSSGDRPESLSEAENHCPHCRSEEWDRITDRTSPGASFNRCNDCEHEWTPADQAQQGVSNASR